MWEESEVEKDVKRCKELGVNTLRVGEFAWGKMEPEEGKFDFGWLKNAVDKLYENGIYTVMCTPTCTPPRWMLDKYEEMRRIMPDVVRSDVSSRCHVCKTSPVAREKNRIIVKEMAKVFGSHPGVIGWQIDNEIFPYGDGCYCPLCKDAFRKYLKDKYGKIENVNKKWGMTRWSLEYEGFEDVQPPYPGQWRHPSLRKAWWDFQCKQIKTFVDEQADILHGYTKTPVGTDMMSHNFLSYYKVNEKLDVAQFNHYNTADELPRTSFWYDFLRTVKDGPFWVTETQVGWNGSEYAESGYRPVGNCYANTWLPVAHGADMNLYWLFRTHPNGHEIGHGALYSTAGRAYRVSEEVLKAHKDFEKCAEILSGSSVKADIALHFSSTAANIFSAAPILKNLDYGDMLIDRYYRAFSNYNLDIIDTQHSLKDYKVVISPFLACADENGFKERITEWVKEGGTWIAGPMTDIMDSDVSKYTNAPYSFLEEIAGVYTKYQKPVHNDVFKAEWRDGSGCGISCCFDAYELNGAESLVKYSGDEFDGLSVVTEKKLGKGKVIFVGSVLDKKDILRLTGIKPIFEASENVDITSRSGKENAVIAVETENKEGFIVLDGKYTDVLTGKELSGKVKVAKHAVLVLKKH